MLRCADAGGAITFAVRVVARARASLSEVAGEHDGALRVRVAAPPVEGAANEEPIRTLARALGVPRRAVEKTRRRAGAPRRRNSRASRARFGMGC